MKKIVFSIFLLIHLYGFNTLAKDFQFKRLDNNSGLSSNQANTIFKDSKGYIWIGTINGLNRFDGYSTTVFQKSKDNPLSLSNNTITMLFEDFRGIIWVMTSNGLNFYNPTTESFSTDDPILHKNMLFPTSNIIDLYSDKEQNIWIVHRTEGIFKYDKLKDVFVHIPLSKIPTGSINYNIDDSSMDTDGCIWLITSGVTVEKFDPQKLQFTEHYSTSLSAIPKVDFAYSIMVDTQKNLWIFSRSKNEGAYRFNPVTSDIIHFNANSDRYRISHNMIACAELDRQGNIWLGTDHGGINVIDKNTLAVTHILNEPGNSNSLSQNSITSLLKDDNGIIWVGTYKKGVNYYHPDLFRFATYTLHPFRSNWLSYEDVNTFAEDRNGNLWIGSNGGGLIYFDRQKNTFKTYKNNPNDPNSISSDVIVDLCVDHLGGLWIATYVGGLNYFDGTKFTRYLNNPNDNNTISHNNVWSVYEDTDHQLWVGTLGGGIDWFERENRKFFHQPSHELPGDNYQYVMSIAENRDKNLWFATFNGIILYHKATRRFIQFIRDENSQNTLSSNTTLDIYCDSRGWTWIATREGLTVYNPVAQKFSNFGKEQGLPDNYIFTILEANNGNMWLATPQGLSNLIIEKEEKGEITCSFKNYNEKDGLHGREFNEHAALKTRNGELVFGGPNGFSIFNPALLSTTAQIPQVVFSKFQVQNKPVEIGHELNNRVLLPKSLNAIGKIELKHFEKTFSVSFAALNFLNPEKTIYHYKLENFNDDWVKTGSESREVTYTNLHPGNYVLKVFASDIENSKQSEIIELKISVLPPFWKTKWAYSLYLIFILVAIFYAIQIIIHRERNKYIIHQERLETAKVHEMDMMKLKFFTNISHEFRTPLTLILTPLDRILKTTENGTNKDQLKLIQRNGKRLLSLVNQLLDFRRLEVQGLTLEIREGEIVGFCTETTESFSDLSETRNITLSFTSNIKELKASFDYDKIEKIIFNLLSNAFKFTPENGSIHVNLLVEENDKEEKWLKLEVCDTGIGIPADKQDLIFERFVQNVPAGVIVNKGSGIGLSLTREFVQMHEGTITVVSKPGEGSCFTVLLPLKNKFKLENITPEIVSNKLIFSETRNKENISKETTSTKEKPWKVLLVEDNPDIRFYLKDNLKTDYEISEAENGLKAWNAILENMPDLIVSDIMMPEMDGIELCRTIKSDPRTSHIPVILLTARSSDQHQYEGLETGADDYITKPFNFEVLELRIKNLIEQRKTLRKHYQKNFNLEPSEVSITSLDEKFLNKVKDLTEKNMHEPNFSVEKLSSDIGISRAHLYNKLLALTGKTPIEYIRILRIRRAAQLLVKSQLTVMEIAYKVGFNDPRYFTKHFKSEYDMTPSQYIKQNSTTGKPDMGF